MQKQEDKSSHQQHWTSLVCKRKLKTDINMDCIKICPTNQLLWAFAFYQQHPEFCGGIQVLSIHDVILQQFGTFGNGVGYVEMGPIMHIQWLNQKVSIKEHFILAAARCDESIICKYQQHDKTLVILSRVSLGKGIFCLYCDWKVIIPTQQQSNEGISIIAAVSSNQSSVFCFHAQINQNQVAIDQIQEYNKHEYAVWACKINPFHQQSILMAVGDEVDCLYLYELSTSTLLAKNKSAHTQGICQLIWKNKQILMSGSFDGSISEVSVTNFSQTLRRYVRDGTIWRIIPLNKIKYEKDTPQLLICNSSNKKFEIINYSQQPSVVWDSGEQHTSLAYAADFNGQYIITASFYDKQIRIWNFNQ